LFGKCSTIVFSQLNQSTPFDQMAYFKILSSAKFYEVNQNGTLEYDTLFISNEDSYFSYYYSDRIEGVDLIMLHILHVDASLKKKQLHAFSQFARYSYQIRTPIDMHHIGKIVAIPKEDFEKLSFRHYFKRQPFFTGGALTLPFKLRRSQEDVFRSLTTDVSLGPYIGLKTRIFRASDISVTFPIAVGVTLITLNEYNTRIPDNNPDTQKISNTINSGLSIGTGLVMHIESYEIGAIVGYDWATGHKGQYWIYDHKPWLSFSIGYSFLN
jgi:hypothetical protein